MEEREKERESGLEEERERVSGLEEGRKIVGNYRGGGVVLLRGRQLGWEMGYIEVGHTGTGYL